MNRERAIEMIRKLVELAAGTPYEQEAASALDKAEELLKKYGLAMAQCRADPQGCTTRERHSGLCRLPGWLGSLFAGIAEVFDCCPLVYRLWSVDRRRLEATFAYIGQPEDVELADFLFEISWKVIAAHLKVCKVARTVKSGYAIGVQSGVLNQIEMMRPKAETREEHGLVLHKQAELKRYLKKHHNMHWDGVGRREGNYDPDIWADGEAAGRDLKLTMGLKDSGQPVPQAIGQGALALEP